MTREPLTPRQMEIYRAIGEHVVDTGHVPTLRDLMKRVGMTSPNGVVGQLRAIERKGWLTVRDDISRGIEVPELVAGFREVGRRFLAATSSVGDPSEPVVSRRTR